MNDISELNIIKLLALNFLGATSETWASLSKNLWPFFETMPVDLVTINKNSGERPENWRIAGWIKLTRKGHDIVLDIRTDRKAYALDTSDPNWIDSWGVAATEELLDTMAKVGKDAITKI